MHSHLRQEDYGKRWIDFNSLVNGDAHDLFIYFVFNLKNTAIIISPCI